MDERLVDASRLSALAAEHWPNVEDTKQIGDLLVKIWFSAREAWPDVEVDPAAFVAHLARHTPSDLSPAPSLEVLQTSALYLVCGCLQGDQAALLELERHCFVGLKPVLQRICPGSEKDVLQFLRQELLVGPQPKITEFRGGGDLRGWVRVCAIRAAMKVQKKRDKEVPLGDAALAEMIAPQDAERMYFKKLYRAEFDVAFRQAFTQLSSRERNVLRNQLLDGLSVQEISRLYRVHRSTAARWVDQIRVRLQDETRDALRVQLDISEEELTSILRLAMSEVDESFRQLLETDG